MLQAIGPTLMKKGKNGLKLTVLF